MSVSAKISQHNGNINWEERPQAESVWLRSAQWRLEASSEALRVEGETAFFVVVVTHEVSKDLVFFSKFEDQSNNFFSCKIRGLGGKYEFLLEKTF